LDVPNFMVVLHVAEDLPYHTFTTAITESSSIVGRLPYFPSDYSSCTCSGPSTAATSSADLAAFPSSKEENRIDPLSTSIATAAASKKLDHRIIVEGNPTFLAAFAPDSSSSVAFAAGWGSILRHYRATH
jgi:hypothetical protein